MTRIKKDLFLCITIFITTGCTKFEEKGTMQEPGLALTFDDNYIDEWYRFIPLFDSFSVKATFYISNYNKFSEKQKEELFTLQQHGHEIAFHSTNHEDFVKYVNKHDLNTLVKEEINKGLQLMNADGFFPSTFAYPFGSHNEVIDHFLLQKFKSVRALNGTNDYSKSLTNNINNKILYALGMDLSSNNSINLLIELIHSAKKNKNCLVLVGHHIDRKDLYMQVPHERLKAILQAARDANLKFYAVSDISK